MNCILLDNKTNVFLPQVLLLLSVSVVGKPTYWCITTTNLTGVSQFVFEVLSVRNSNVFNNNRK